MIARTRLNVTLYAHWRSCYISACRRGGVQFQLKKIHQSSNKLTHHAFCLLHNKLLLLEEQNLQVYPIKHSGDYIYHPL